MKNFLYALAAIIVIAAIIIVINWNSIMNWWNQPKEGDKCILSFEPAYIEGIIHDGKCVAKNNISGNSDNINGTNPPVQYDLQVSNPKGAYMYYQSVSPASGGMIYGRSNVLLPYGAKLKLIKTWQTNLSTQPFSGYYETEYKNYGPLGGFFTTQDVMKINNN